MENIDLICSLELEDLNMAANCGNNMSGVKNIYIALKSDVATFPKLPNVREHYNDFAILEGNITMKASKKWRSRCNVL